MGLFARLRERFRQSARRTPASPDEAAPSPSVAEAENPKLERAADGRLDRLARFGDEGGPDQNEALALLRELRTTPLEGSALAVLSARIARLPDELATAAAKACLDRGEPQAARVFLSRTESPASRLLAADIAEEEGNAPLALALVERVLAQAIDHPGARERHARLATALGRKAPEPAPAARDGTVLSAHVQSPYVIRREIARGGAAAVYEAEDRELGRVIGLKVYHDPNGGRTQLLHEAQIATELAQPGVVRVFDVDLRGGWLVLEYFSHGSLREWLRERALDLIGLEWLRTLAVTLDDVHARGFVHLDVKPGNILLRSARDAVLSDFGSARRIGDASPPGSLGYVSPERLGGAVASAADDTYGFGRICEDLLARAGHDLPDARRTKLGELARRCIGPAAERPRRLSAALDMIPAEV
jgi:serine/threonine-protein kinase